LLSALIAGITLGLAAGFSPGPLMALVIAHALQHNVREGILVALAPLVTDAPIILAALFLLSRFAHFEPALGVVSVIGGGYVLYLAYETMKAGPLVNDAREARPRSLGKGVLVNVLNPHPYLFWGTVGAPFMLVLRQSHPVAPWVFIACFFAALVGSKILIAFLAGKLRSVLMGRAYVRIMRVLAVTLVAFALLLFKHAFNLLA